MKHPLIDEGKYLEFAEKIAKADFWRLNEYEERQTYPLTIIALALLDIAKTLKEKK